MDEFKYEFLEELREGLTPEQFVEKKRKEIDEICMTDFYISSQASTEHKDEVLESMVEEYEREYEMYLKEHTK